MTQMKPTPSRSAAANTTAVASPRRHPRSARYFTAGSRAKERNKASSSETSKPRTLWITHTPTRVPSTVKTSTTSRRGIHGGRRTGE